MAGYYLKTQRRYSRLKFMGHNLLAESETPLGPFEGLGPLGKIINSLTPDTPGPAVSLFAKIISIAIGVMTVVAFIWFIFVLFTGAIGWLGAGGDKTRIQNSQKQITNGLVGLLIVIVATLFIKVIGLIFRIDILSFGIITTIWNP